MACLEIDAHPAEPDRLARSRGGHDRPARRGELAELGLEPRDELAAAHGLGDVVVGPGVERARDAGLVVAAADEDDRHERVESPHLAAQLDARTVRQNPVEQDGCRLLAREGGEAGLGVRAPHRVEAFALDVCAQQLRRVRVVFDDEHGPALP